MSEESERYLNLSGEPFDAGKLIISATADALESEQVRSLIEMVNALIERVAAFEERLQNVEDVIDGLDEDG